jgi:hypothetical protein
MGVLTPEERGALHRKLAELRRLSAMAPGDPDLRLALARLMLELEWWESAEAELRTVIAMAPNSLEARQLLELALRRQPSKPA